MCRKKNSLNGNETFPEALKELALSLITREGIAKKHVGRNGNCLILMGFSNLSRNFSVFYSETEIKLGLFQLSSKTLLH